VATEPAITEPGTDFLTRTLDRKELERAQDVIGAAARLLGREQGETGPEAVAELLAELEGRLADGGGAELDERLAHEQQLERLRARFRHRNEAFSRIEAGVGRLREVTSPAAILAAAPRELCDSSDFERVLISTVSDGRMAALAAHFDADPEGAEEALAKLAERPIRLEHPLLEAEVLRRRRATAVTDAQLHPRVSDALTEAMAWDSYVIAPVLVQGRVIAILHGDRPNDGLDVLDREVLWRFAVSLGQAYESASLRRRLRQEREQMRRFLDRLDARLGELSDSAVQLAPWESSPSPELEAQPAGDPGSAFEGVLTRRESEVLGLMAEGLSNRKIADRLVISEGTVKFHVNSILRKLRATNRAEAVSRYLKRTLPPR
jgi:DNA-binding CsgD family transcriptional regulator